jgi:hypothetical protein
VLNTPLSDKIVPIGYMFPIPRLGFSVGLRIQPEPEVTGALRDFTPHLGLLSLVELKLQDSPMNHAATTYEDFERIAKGEYRIV